MYRYILIEEKKNFPKSLLYSSSNGHTGGNKELKESMEDLLNTYNVSLALWGDGKVE